MSKPYLRVPVVLIFLGAILGAASGAVLVAIAAPAYDQTAGTYTDDFADASGIAATSSVARDPGSESIKLINASGTIAAPYLTSGFVRTVTIIPTSVAAWANITFSGTTNASSSIKVQVLDGSGTLFPDSLLPGNSAGFTSTTTNISALPVDRAAENAASKIARIQLRFTLTTSDTSFTPSLNDIALSWTTRQGSTASTTLANTAWPSPDGDAFGTRHVPSAPDSAYRVLRWVNDQGVNYGGETLRGTGELIYNKTQGGTSNGISFTEATLSALNRNTGSSTWERLISGFAFTVPNITLAENGSLYMADFFNDLVIAYDENGTPKWTYQFGTGHGNGSVAIASDGTAYAGWTDSSDDTFSIYAFNADGTVRWATSTNPTGTIGVTRISFSPDFSRLYIAGNSASTPGTGKIYAFSPATGAPQWNYTTGEVNFLVGSDGTIYAANNNAASYHKRITALNGDGTLRWERSIGTSTDWWAKMALSDDVLLVERVNSSFPSSGGAIEGVNPVTGGLLWSLTIDSQADVLSGGLLSDPGGFLIHPSVFGASTSMIYYDYNRTMKWRWDLATASKHFSFTSQDEDGGIYATMFDEGTFEADLLGFAPWTIGVTTTPSVAPGGTVTITATTTMPATDPWSGSANKMQVILEDSTKVLLSASSSANGVSTWTGTFTAPITLVDGFHPFTVQAASVGVQTDQATNFVSAPAGSNNTGRSFAAAYTSLVPVTVSAGYTGSGSVLSLGGSSAPTPPAPPVATSTATSNPAAPSAPAAPAEDPVVKAILALNLPQGFHHPAILLLQQYLNAKGFLVAITGPGAPGEETDYYGPATAAALERYAASAGSQIPLQKVLFTRNLRPGMSHPDVALLQRFLNKQGFPVAASGPGSPGEETELYGSGTTRAVRAFQEKYAKDILAPLGLARGTGIFGEATRNFANTLAAE